MGSFFVLLFLIMNTRYSISVVIPNYNGIKLLKENLPAVYKVLDFSVVDYEIILVDDCSTDNSVGFITSHYPDIKLINNRHNEGFSPTINKGIMAAKKDLVLALNSDVLLQPDYLSAQFKYFEDEDTFGVMGRIIGLHDDNIQDAAKYPQQRRSKISGTKNYLPIHAADFEQPLPSLFLSGANALMDRKKVQALLGFDPIYAPFYVEDLDLSMRAWRMGWKCYYEHQAICRHPVSATIATYHTKRKIKLIASRNKFIFHALHLQGKDLVYWYIQLFFELLYRWTMGNFTFYRAFFLFLGKQQAIQQSKHQLHVLAQQQQRTLLSGGQVIQNIQSRLQQIPLMRF